jgi:hypothetical protein
MTAQHSLLRVVQVGQDGARGARAGLCCVPLLTATPAVSPAASRLQSMAEQFEVEQWFSAGTWLFPSYHESYWIGYHTYNSWPNFNPIDGTVKKGYTHWGTFQVRVRVRWPGRCPPPRAQGRSRACRAAVLRRASPRAQGHAAPPAPLSDSSAGGWSAPRQPSQLPQRQTPAIPSKSWPVAVGCLQRQRPLDAIGPRCSRSSDPLHSPKPLPTYLLPSPQPGSGPAKKEPNELDTNFPLDCAVANYTQRYGSPAAWGWADDKCSRKHVFACRNACERLAGALGAEANSSGSACLLRRLRHPAPALFVCARRSCQATLCTPTTRAASCPSCRLQPWAPSATARPRPASATA